MKTPELGRQRLPIRDSIDVWDAGRCRDKRCCQLGGIATFLPSSLKVETNGICIRSAQRSLAD
jgi:hypothetical protein